MEKDLEVFKACADQTRLRLLFLLAERELCVCELVEVLAMPQGKISRHLGVLKHADLVQSRREGTWIYYALRRSDTGLQKRLHLYLRAASQEHARAVEDLRCLNKLAARGQICVPREARRASAAPALKGAR